MTQSRNGVLQLPPAMRRDLIVLLGAKALALTLIYWLFFSPAHQPVIDVAARIAGAQMGP